MGETIRLTSPEDGFEYDAYRAAPQEARRGGLVICHAIWGVTPHLRQLADEYADQGYEVLVPSLFDRFGRGFPEQDTDPPQLQKRMDIGARTGWGADVLDAVQAAIDALPPPVFCIGFCYGGTVAWLAAARCTGLAAVSSFYGGNVAQYASEAPEVPTILHLGKQDEYIPPADVETIRSHHPDLQIYLYDAGHGFVAPSGYHEDSARLAKLRTAAFFARAAGGRGEAP